jgi:hypothetical protein
VKPDFAYPKQKEIEKEDSKPFFATILMYNDDDHNKTFFHGNKPNDKNF